MAITGMHIGGEIARALGLPPETTDILISIGLDEPVTILCRHYPSEEAMRAVLGVLAKYRLEAVEDDPCDDLFTQAQRSRMFRRGLLRGEAGIESPYLQRYLARKAELAAWEQLLDDLHVLSPDKECAVLHDRIAALVELIARMEAGEAV